MINYTTRQNIKRAIRLFWKRYITREYIDLTSKESIYLVKAYQNDILPTP